MRHGDVYKFESTSANKSKQQVINSQLQPIRVNNRL